MSIFLNFFNTFFEYTDQKERGGQKGVMLPGPHLATEALSKQLTTNDYTVIKRLHKKQKT